MVTEMRIKTRWLWSHLSFEKILNIKFSGSSLQVKKAILIQCINCIRLLAMSIFTARKRSLGKVIFLHLCVILFTSGGSLSQHASQVTWQGGLCPGQGLCQGGVSVMEGLCPKLWLCPKGSLCRGSLSRGGVSSGRSPLYINERAVRILLECILVCLAFASCEHSQHVGFVYIEAKAKATSLPGGFIENPI